MFTVTDFILTQTNTKSISIKSKMDKFINV